METHWASLSLLVVVMFNSWGNNYIIIHMFYGDKSRPRRTLGVTMRAFTVCDCVCVLVCVQLLSWRLSPPCVSQGLNYIWTVVWTKGHTHRSRCTDYNNTYMCVVTPRRRQTRCHATAFTLNPSNVHARLFFFTLFVAPNLSETLFPRLWWWSRGSSEPRLQWVSVAVVLKVEAQQLEHQCRQTEAVFWRHWFLCVHLCVFFWLVFWVCYSRLNSCVGFTAEG